MGRRALARVVLNGNYESNIEFLRIPAPRGVQWLD